MRRKEMFNAVIGGIVGAVLVMTAGSIVPLGAHNEVKGVEFGQITCRRIEVLDSDGEKRVIINGEYVLVGNADGSVGLIAAKNGGVISMSGQDGEMRDLDIYHLPERGDEHEKTSK